MYQNKKLTVGIVGAEIAGLSAAIAFRRAGWDVEIFEKSSFANGTDAGILLGCNATKIRVPNAATLVPGHTERFPEFSSRYGDKWLSFHRQDLHDGLLAAATPPHSHRNAPAKLNLGTAITTIDPAASRITLALGKRIHKDLLIIANGVRTTLQPSIIGYDNPLIVAPISTYRCLVPMCNILDDPTTRPLLANEPPSLLILKLQESTVCASYPVRSNTMLSISYVHPTKPSERGIIDWNTSATHAEVEESFPAFHPAVRALPLKAIGKESSMICYPVVTRREIPTYVNGRALLLGDAAHPMFTFHGQGASMAIESCGALEVFFKDLAHPNLIYTRLSLFDEFRHGRCVATQLMSNSMAGALQNDDIIRRIGRHYDGPLPPADTKSWGEGFRDFFFSYDVFRESLLFLEEHDIRTSYADSRKIWHWLFPAVSFSLVWKALWKPRPKFFIFNTWFNQFCYVTIFAKVGGSSNLRDCVV